MGLGPFSLISGSVTRVLEMGLESRYAWGQRGISLIAST